MSRRILLTIVSIALLSLALLPGLDAAQAESDDLITGTSLVVKPGGLAKLSGTGTLDMPDAANAPNLRGGALVIFDGGGSARDAYRLPAQGWTRLTAGWLYKGAGSDDDPCTAVKLTPKAVKAKCTKSGVTLTPPFVGPVAAVLSIAGAQKSSTAPASAARSRRTIRSSSRRRRPPRRPCVR